MEVWSEVKPLLALPSLLEVPVRMSLARDSLLVLALAIGAVSGGDG